MPKIKVNDVELNYEEHGSGAETVVFGHGFGSSARKWQNLFELLPANYHCYALDLQGFGKSAEITENINPAQMADDIYQFSKEMGLGKFVYVGYSMGGRVGLDPFFRIFRHFVEIPRSFVFQSIQITLYILWRVIF